MSEFYGVRVESVLPAPTSGPVKVSFVFAMKYHNNTAWAPAWPADPRAGILQAVIHEDFENRESFWVSRTEYGQLVIGYEISSVSSWINYEISPDYMALTPGQVHLIAVTWDASLENPTAKIYIDGVLYAKAVTTEGWHQALRGEYDGSGQVIVHAGKEPHHWYRIVDTPREEKENLDEISIFDRVLSEEEVEYLWQEWNNAGEAAPPPGGGEEEPGEGGGGGLNYYSLELHMISNWPRKKSFPDGKEIEEALPLTTAFRRLLLDNFRNDGFAEHLGELFLWTAMQSEYKGVLGSLYPPISRYHEREPYFSRKSVKEIDAVLSTYYHQFYNVVEDELRKVGLKENVVQSLATHDFEKMRSAKQRVEYVCAIITMLGIQTYLPLKEFVVEP